MRSSIPGSLSCDWVNACHPEWDAQYERVLTKRLPQLVAEKSRVFVVTLPH